MKTPVEDLKEALQKPVRFTRIDDIVRVFQPAGTVQRGEYKSAGQIPIVDQGQSTIAGFTDDEAFLIPEGQYVVFGDHTRLVQWVDFPFAAGADGVKILEAKETVLPKYLYYAITTLSIPNRGYNRHWTVLRELKIPLPTLETQRAIVQILDMFENLEANLEAELQARILQFASIKALVLRGESESERVSELGEIADLWLGRTKAPLTSSNYVSVENLVSNFGGRIDSKSVPLGAAISYQPQDILLGNIRPYLKKIWFADREGGSSADVLTVRLKPGIETTLLHRYLYHVLASDRFFDFSMAHARGAKMPRGSKEATFKFLVPLPPLETQTRVVRLMDHLESLTSNSSIGLHAEIAARRKQCEHYRDQLFNFTEAQE